MRWFGRHNPITRVTSPKSLVHYRVGPYVLAGDVYGVAPHTGRGGWTWYSGAAGWLYRTGVEALLGLKRHGDELEVAPCLPRDWPGYSAQLRCGARSEEHTSELQSLMRISYAVFCLKKKTTQNHIKQTQDMEVNDTYTMHT